MTIHEHDGLPSQAESGNRAAAHALVDRLNAGEPYAVVFGGQGHSSWLSGLEEIVTTAGIESELRSLVGDAERLLGPVADELVVVRPVGFAPLHWARSLAAFWPSRRSRPPAPAMSSCWPLPSSSAPPGRWLPVAGASWPSATAPRWSR